MSSTTTKSKTTNEEVEDGKEGERKRKKKTHTHTTTRREKRTHSTLFTTNQVEDGNRVTEVTLEFLNNKGETTRGPRQHLVRELPLRSGSLRE
jgi:hypothetical protein